MKGDRANKVQATEYEEGFYRIQESITGADWDVIDGSVYCKTFLTLHDAREWCKEHPADEETEGKYC